MLKKNLCLFLAVLFFFAGTAWAGEDDRILSELTPQNLTFYASLDIADAQYELTNNLVERVFILSESAERYLWLIEDTDDLAILKMLLDKYQNQEEEMWGILNNLDGPGTELVAELVGPGIQNRTQHLQSITENLALKRTARPNLEKAIENQEKVISKFEEVLAKTPAPGQASSTPAAPGQSGSAPGQTSSTPAAPGQSGSAPGQTSSTPGQSGSTPAAPAAPATPAAPGNSGSAPGNSGSTPAAPATPAAPGNSGSAPGNSGSAPGNSGSAPGQGN